MDATVYYMTQKEYFKQWYSKNKDKVAIRVKEYRKQHKKQFEEYQKQYKKTHQKQRKEYHKFYRTRIKYGVSKTDWYSLLKKQKNKCAICKNFLPTDIRKLCIDHCHKSGKIRGIVHNDCNLMIGFSKKNVEVLKSAIKYIQKYSK